VTLHGLAVDVESEGHAKQRAQIASSLAAAALETMAQDVVAQCLDRLRLPLPLDLASCRASVSIRTLLVRFRLLVYWHFSLVLNYMSCI
jgi:hypothetical protein